MDDPAGERVHDDAPILRWGAPLEDARAAVILVHGRGSTARDILTLAPLLADVAGGGGPADPIEGGGSPADAARARGRPENRAIAFLAPQAAGGTWYPYGFMAPMARNEPGLSSGLRLLGTLIERGGRDGPGLDRTVLVGFSQGGCLALEFVARNARAYGGVAGLSAGLIGPDGTPREYRGSLEGTPILLGCSDADPHIPLARVRESAAVFRRLGGDVTERIYPGMGHAVNEDEVAVVRAWLDRLTRPEE